MRLKPDPVPNELIRGISEAGVCALNGGKYVALMLLVIRDAKIKETVGGLYKRAWTAWTNKLPQGIGLVNRPLA